MTELTYLSLFSGIGGFELALAKAARFTKLPVRCVGYSEIDGPCISIYERHFDHAPFGDITGIDAAALPDFELVVGGFPCQAFSYGGLRRGFEDTRGTLIFDVLRIVKEKAPRYILLENVDGLIGHDQGRTFRTILRAFDELGYDLQWKVLNSKDHRVPQFRARVYIVGSLGGHPRPQVFRPSTEGNPHTRLGKYAEATVSRTLTAGGHSGGNHSGMTILRTPEGDRRLTPVEWERLQGYPDNWTDNVPDTQRYKALGNAVTVPVAFHPAVRLLMHHRTELGLGAFN